jgi:hypothetical protein
MTMIRYFRFFFRFAGVFFAAVFVAVELQHVLCWR